MSDFALFSCTIFALSSIKKWSQKHSKELKFSEETDLNKIFRRQNKRSLRNVVTCDSSRVATQTKVKSAPKQDLWKYPIPMRRRQNSPAPRALTACYIYILTTMFSFTCDCGRLRDYDRWIEENFILLRLRFNFKRNFINKNIAQFISYYRSWLRINRLPCDCEPS